MKKNAGESIKNTEPIIVTALLLIFALIALAIVSQGAQTYGTISATMEDNYDIRTSLSYVATKIRQGDVLGAISIEETPFGVQSLVLTEQDGEDSYKTWIYFHEGAMREFYGYDDLEFQGDDGNVIVNLNSFTVSMNENNLVDITVENNNDIAQSISVATRCK